MKIDQIKKIESELKQPFWKKYSQLRVLLYISSFFGNAMSILLAFFFMSKLLFESVSFITSDFVIWFISLLILLGLELFKRSLFSKFSVEFVSNKMNFMKKEILILGISSLLVIIFSFYSSLRGAREFTSKDVLIQNNSESIIKNYSDSINNITITQIDEIQSEIKLYKQKIEEKDSEQTEIQSNVKLNRNQLQRIKDLKDEKIQLKNQISLDEQKIEKTNKENLSKIEEFKLIELRKGDEQQSDNKNNSMIFVIISTIIELLILIGIFFDKYYKWIAYTEYRKKTDNDPLYQKWINYNKLLELVYNTDSKIGDRINSASNLLEISKTNGLILNSKEITEFLRLVTNLKILKLSGSFRYIQRDRDTSFELLKNNFKID